VKEEVMELDHQEQFWISRISIATVFFTGFSGLVYEVIWQRYLANLLGSEAKSTCVILAVFLGGLAIGYRLFGKLSSSKSPSSVVKLCGMCEIGIGIWAFAFPQIYSLVWNAIGVVNPESPFSTTYEILLAIALIGVPTILMGCTLPLLTQGLSFSTKRVPKVHALIYAWNTGGAFLGCLIAGFVLLPKFGLPITIMTTALINIVAGVILAGLGAELSDEASPIAKTTVQKTNIFAIATAFIAGFVGITFQILLMRIAGLSLGSSDYTFSMIVAIYILMLALGAASLQRSKDSSQGKLLVLNQILLICGLCAFYFVVPYIPYLILLIRTSFSSVIVAFYFYYLTAGLAFGLILLIPLTSIGRGMPLLF
jgi:spermidine synthase